MSEFFPLERLILLGSFLYIGHLLWHKHKNRIKSWFKDQKAKLPRHWKPKSPDDCHACCSNVRILRPLSRNSQPWSERKSTRGRKKSVKTQGFACLNGACDYFGVRDEAVHALVADGKRRDIQYFKCQCCGKSATARKGTPLYYLKHPQDQIEIVLWFLVEGVDISVMVRFTGYTDSTLTRWLLRMGKHSTSLHDHFFSNLHFDTLQLDELYARVRNSNKSRWLWLVIDPMTKALPALHVGGRTSDDAYTLRHDLKQRLKQDSVPAFTSDGLRSYFYAITAHFGAWHLPDGKRKEGWNVHPRLLYGQLIKRKKNRKLVFAITRMVWGKRSELKVLHKSLGLSDLIQTAFIERVNLTIRQSVSLLTRKTWSYAKHDQHLELHLQWWRVYYHFVRPHDSLKRKIHAKSRKRTPAMALGLTDKIWSVGDILTYPLILDETAA